MLNEESAIRYTDEQIADAMYAVTEVRKLCNIWDDYTKQTEFPALTKVVMHLRLALPEEIQ